MLPSWGNFEGRWIFQVTLIKNGLYINGDREKIHTNGQEHIEKAVVSAKGQHDEIDTVNDASAISTPLGDNGGVHDIVPILFR